MRSARSRRPRRRSRAPRSRSSGRSTTAASGSRRSPSQRHGRSRPSSTGPCCRRRSSRKRRSTTWLERLPPCAASPSRPAPRAFCSCRAGRTAPPSRSSCCVPASRSPPSSGSPPSSVPPRPRSSSAPSRWTATSPRSRGRLSSSPARRSRSHCRRRTPRPRSSASPPASPGRRRPSSGRAARAGSSPAASWGVDAGADLGAARDVAERALAEPGPVSAHAAGLPQDCAVSTTLPLGRPPLGVLQLFHPAGEEPEAEQLTRLATFGVRAAHALRTGERARQLALELERTQALLEVIVQATVGALRLAHARDRRRACRRAAERRPRGRLPPRHG